MFVFHTSWHKWSCKASRVHHVHHRMLAEAKIWSQVFLTYQHISSTVCSLVSRAPTTTGIHARSYRPFAPPLFSPDNGRSSPVPYPLHPLPSWWRPPSASTWRPWLLAWLNYGGPSRVNHVRKRKTSLTFVMKMSTKRNIDNDVNEAGHVGSRPRHGSFGVQGHAPPSCCC